MTSLHLALQECVSLSIYICPWPNHIQLVIWVQWDLGMWPPWQSDHLTNWTTFRPSRLRFLICIQATLPKWPPYQSDQFLAVPKVVQLSRFHCIPIAWLGSVVHVYNKIIIILQRTVKGGISEGFPSVDLFQLKVFLRNYKWRKLLISLTVYRPIKSETYSLHHDFMSQAGLPGNNPTEYGFGDHVGTPAYKN